MRSACTPVLLAAVLFWLPAAAQQATEPPAVVKSGQETDIFLFDWPQGRPWISYFLKVGADGKTHFEGDPNAAEPGDSDPFQQDFLLSRTNRQKIFDLAKKANYFQGNFDYPKKIAQTGKKTLEYESPSLQTSTTYNWSQNTDIQELTRIFQGIATTLDYGRKLTFQYRFDKLGMDQRIKELEQLQQQGYVEELQAIEPILQKIADDPNIMHISRETAKHLLKTIGNPENAANAPQPPASQP